MTLSRKPESPRPTDSPGAKERPWEMRIWHGITLGVWLRLLARNRFAISPSRIAMAAIITVVSALNSVLWLMQTILLGRRIARTQLVDDPVFVLGHWRSGTTLLHELLAADPRHTYANTFVSFSPNHFLLTGRVFPKIFGALLPPMRPMDNMPVKWEYPQEDEWAMCNMGASSPYLTVVFPNNPPQCPEYLDLRDVPAAALAKWQSTFLGFLRCLTVQNPKRIVLKSPQHTCRVRTLLEMFPKARFVHIVRDPYFIFPSTMKTWKRMYKYHGLQVPRFEGLEEFVFHVFERMYGVFEEDRGLIPPGQLCEVRYEDLVRDPMREMRRVYKDLDLGDFEPARPAVEAYVVRTSGYRPSRYDLDPALCAEIGRRWAAYCQRYGYTAPAAANTASDTPAAQSGAA